MLAWQHKIRRYLPQRSQDESTKMGSGMRQDEPFSLLRDTLKGEEVQIQRTRFIQDCLRLTTELLFE